MVCGRVARSFVYIHNILFCLQVCVCVSVCLSDHDICLNFLKILCSYHHIVANNTHYALSSAEHGESNLQPDPEEVIHNVMPINNLKS